MKISKDRAKTEIAKNSQTAERKINRENFQPAFPFCKDIAQKHRRCWVWKRTGVKSFRNREWQFPLESNKTENLFALIFMKRNVGLTDLSQV